MGDGWGAGLVREGRVWEGGARGMEGRGEAGKRGLLPPNKITLDLVGIIRAIERPPPTPGGVT